MSYKDLKILSVKYLAKLSWSLKQSDYGKTTVKRIHFQAAKAKIQEMLCTLDEMVHLPYS